MADTLILSRWRARCSRAAETGSGLPWCWRRRRRYAPGLMRAVVWAAGARSVLEVQVAIVTGSLAGPVAVAEAVVEAYHLAAGDEASPENLRRLLEEATVHLGLTERRSA